jgi:Kef-type K+ transport system membrane component KefB
MAWLHRTLPQPSSLISCIALVTLLGAAGSEHLGLHSFLGAFVVGIALADVYRDLPRPFEVLGEFSYAVFTPVFFVSMAIGSDFIEGFDPWLVVLVTTVAFVGKICGVFIGGRLAGMDSRQSLAVGCGLNARGILGIVMAAAAHDAQLIDLRLFVACVLMCVITTMAAGPALSLILGKREQPAVEA